MSRDEDDTKVADVAVPRTFTPIKPADVTDEKLAPGMLRRLEVEMRTGFDLIAERLQRIVEAVEHIAIKQEDVINEVERLKRPLKAVRSK